MCFFAPAERVFSLIKAVWTQEHSELRLERTASITLIKFNTSQSCTDFYRSIKENTAVLEAIKSGKKYKNTTVPKTPLNPQKTPLELNAELNAPMSCCSDDEREANDESEANDD